MVPSDTREYNNGIGRWMTPDPDNAGADVTDPQSWNMYAYVGDNPTSRNDPSGISYCKQDSSNNIDLSTCVSDKAYESLKDTKGYLHVSQDTSITVSGSQATQQDYMFALGVAATTARTEIKRAAVTMAINGALAGAGAAIGAGIDWLAASRGATASGNLVDATVHGAKRLAQASRLDPVQAIKAELQATMRYTQADGARVFVEEISPGKFNVVVKNPATNKIVTVLKSIDRRALANLARNYGWR